MFPDFGIPSPPHQKKKKRKKVEQLDLKAGI